MVNEKYTNTWKIQLNSVSLYYKKCFESIISLRSYTQLSYSEGSVHEGRKRHIRNLQLIKQKIETEGGGFDMCKAIKEMLRDSRQEGQDEMATLIEKLILSNRISELLKVTTDKEYRNKLLIEYGIAWLL